jgi:hypothetical protein
MDGIIKLALAIVTQLASVQRIAITGPRTIAAILLALAAAMAGLAAIGCAVAALWIFLIPYIGAAGAALSAAAVLLAVSAVLLIGGYTLLKRNRSPMETIAEAIQSGEGRKLARDYKPLLLAGSVLAGLVAALNATRKKSP